MKSLLCSLFLAFSLNAQSLIPGLPDPPPPLSMSVYDGSTGYCTKANPTGLDLSGAEMITAFADRNFSSKDSLHWTGSGNHSIDTSSVDKRTGTYSGKITSTAAGDTTTNYVKLPAANFTPITTADIGKKYCVEGFFRAVSAGTKVTLNVGTKSQQSATLSTVAGTFTKAVLNFQATASEVGMPLRVFVNQADVTYVDDVSLTQKKDAIILVGAKYSAGATFAGNPRILNYRTTTSYGYHIYGVSATNYAGSAIGDGTTSIIASSSTVSVSDSRGHAFASVINSTGNLTFYSDGIAGTGSSITSIGKVSPSTLIYFGCESTPSSYWQGQAYPIQIILFDALPSDDGAAIVADANNLFKQNRPYRTSYAGGVVALDINWKTLLDASINKNNLTPVGGVYTSRKPRN